MAIKEDPRHTIINYFNDIFCDILCCSQTGWRVWQTAGGSRQMLPLLVECRQHPTHRHLTFNFLNVTEIRSQIMYCLTVFAESGLATTQTSGNLSVCFHEMHSRLTLESNDGWSHI